MDPRADFLRIAEAAVRESGLFLKANLHRRPEATFKGDVDLVTEFDMGAQEILAGRLSEAFPDHGILAEEDLTRPGRSEYRWVVDPLDGTTNYAHTFPVFSVSAALERAGRTILGLVYDPMRDEMFAAREGQGAVLNGRAIRVSEVGELGKSLLAAIDSPIANRATRHVFVASSTRCKRDRSEHRDRMGGPEPPPYGATASVGSPGR